MSGGVDDYFRSLNRDIEKRLSSWAIERHVRPAIYRAAKEVLREATPSNVAGYADNWFPRYSGGAIHMQNSSFNATRGRRIYLALLLGKRTSGWVIEAKPGKKLVFEVEDDGGNMRKVAAPIVYRRYAHSQRKGLGKWRHVNFVRIESRIAARANKALAAAGYPDIKVSSSDVKI